MDRFELEQRIMETWQTADDIKLIFEMYSDRPERMSEDELMNLLIGLNHLHTLRSQKLFDVFETLVGDGTIKNKD